MAILDPRLLPLIETLTEVGADWLAFELVDGIRRGVEEEEPAEMLELARARVRSGEPGERLTAKPAEQASPILGDDQIVWAAQYVAGRFDAALRELAGATDLLEAIVGELPPPGVDDEGHVVQAGASEPVTIVIDDEAGHSVTRDDIRAARASLQNLRQSLDDWSLTARGLTSV